MFMRGTRLAEMLERRYCPAEQEASAITRWGQSFPARSDCTDWCVYGEEAGVRGGYARTGR